MDGYLGEHDILVIVYPNLFSVEAVMIINPYDKKVSFYEASSIEEVKEILRNHLPFCDQGHDTYIHGGRAYVLEWDKISSSKLSITFPEDIDKVLS